MDCFLQSLGDELQDVNEEAFELFSLSPPLPGLGMVDTKAEEVELSVAGVEFTIKQSIGALHSQREGGTTGAAVWRTSIHVAEWLSSATNALFTSGVIGANSTVFELGSGISGIVACAVSPRVHRVVATDQPYTLKLLRKNIETNTPRLKRAGGKSNREGRSKSNIDVVALDWETDDVHSLLRSTGLPHGVDAVVACDTVYNYALIAPFIEACIDVCRLRQMHREDSGGGETVRPTTTICIVAQQLRQAEVFEQWLEAFTKAFRVWRVPTEMLSPSMGAESGFAIHIGVLRDPPRG